MTRPGAIDRELPFTFEEMRRELAADVAAGLDRADRLDALARALGERGESAAAAAATRCAHRARREATFLRDLGSELDAGLRAARR